MGQLWVWVCTCWGCCAEQGLGQKHQLLRGFSPWSEGSATQGSTWNSAHCHPLPHFLPMPRSLWLSPLLPQPPALSCLAPLFCFLQAMAVIVFLTLTVLGIVHNPLQLGDELDAVMHRFIQNVQSSWAGRWISWCRIYSKYRSRTGWPGKTFSLLPSSYGVSEPLLLGQEPWSFCWRTRKRSYNPESSCKQGSPRIQEEKEKKEKEVEEDEDSGGTCDLGKFLADCIQWPMLFLADTSKFVGDLVDEPVTVFQRFFQE